MHSFIDIGIDFLVVSDSLAPAPVAVPAARKAAPLVNISRRSNILASKSFIVRDIAGPYCRQPKMMRMDGHHDLLGRHQTPTLSAD
jgi:hypothetical protein